MLYINGRFLQKPVTGTERFAREITWAMDAILAEREGGSDVTLIAPPGTPAPQGLRVIKFRTEGKRQGHAWEQYDLCRATKDGSLLSLTNSGPVFHRRQAVVIHDAAPYRIPKDFSFGYTTLHRCLGHILARRARLVTVSYFSRTDLSQVLRIPECRIAVVHNGHEHIMRSSPDDGILGTLGLIDRPYFLFVGAPVPRKNLATALRAFAALDRKDAAFVIVGASNKKVFRAGLENLPDNAILPGRLSDEEIVSLYRHARALVFPSLYEGFGIPPLEAMVHRCPVIASDIPPVREVCAEAARYFDPRDADACTAAMRDVLDNADLRESMRQAAAARCRAFSWRESAAKILAVVES